MRMNPTSGTMEPQPAGSAGLLGQAQHVLEEFVARHPSTAQDALAYKLEVDGDPQMHQQGAARSHGQSALSR